jgi:hypothetical protein
MTTQPQSPSEQEIRDCVEQAASTDYKVMCLQALVTQAADKREQEVLEAVSHIELEGMSLEGKSLWDIAPVKKYIADRLTQLRQGGA